MDFEQYFAREWKSVSSAAPGSENFSGCFDCNICFEFAHEPVVTLCGHLYCWPCIYKWLHVQSTSLASDEHPQCPVCKADISHTTMVPLYGRGQAPAEAEIEIKGASRGMAIPPRPSACGALALVSTAPHAGQQLAYRNPYQNQNFTSDPYSSFQDGTPSPLVNLTGSPHPFAAMLGEMVYARVFGNSESLYAYRNSYHLMGSNSPRLRRQEMQADKSLNRISIFLFCCFLLCLIVF
ncbi:E3 ubiquitin-protein ligase RMA1H1-like [Mercurialis annua]|uniref:E3 ubiquitin-protein ligase RMA1H1-like n=1 Tax=Mercurialis annua TaxID=3986 RepID=UPI00215F594F|nr:E3 ubiquitin-protein ligase RMA1H1-like [Mercurialis annua]XP_050213546.1 E3 ubiquitin-protein ligase RMA1H1-like [Mercurialis annua]